MQLVLMLRFHHRGFWVKHGI